MERSPNPPFSHETTLPPWAPPCHKNHPEAEVLLLSVVICSPYCAVLQQDLWAQVLFERSYTAPWFITMASLDGLRRSFITSLFLLVTGLTQDVFIVLHDRWDILCSGQENGISGHSSQMHSWACCHFTWVAQWIINICACFLGLHHLSVLTFWITFSNSHSGICVIIWSCALLFLFPKNSSTC